MACEYCLRPETDHDPRCPMYEPPKSRYTCEICGAPLLVGDDYIRNEYDEYIHYDCPSTRQLIDFLGGKVGEVQDEECDS